jgi:stage VI sporulation protein D
VWKEESRLEQSYLRFSIEEAIWFKKGQEVSEFISISLDPVITVDEYEQYITIRGALELTGEYLMVDEEPSEAFTDLSAHRLVQEVTTREDGISELTHRFPVDITIPKNRIQSLDDVYVTIESFDYDLEEGGRLLLTADISISGIYGSQQSVPNIEENSDELEAAERSEKYEENQEETEDVLEPLEVVTRKEAREENQEKTEDVPEPLEVVTRKEVREENQEETEDLFDPFEVVTRKEVHEENQDERKEKIEAPSMKVELKSQQDETVAAEETDVAEAVQQADVEEGKKEKKVSRRNENALYLTKIFAKEEQQDFSRLKICIVQQGESIDQIAERYDVSVQQLLRVNQLEHEADISEGQLLYIPIPAGSRT